MKGRRREYQKRETRRLLLDTAYDVFLEKGYEKTTIKDLAERAGVAQGTFFKHFPDKMSLIAAAFETDMRAVEDECFQSLPDTDLKSRLMYITRRFFGFYEPRPALGDILLRRAMSLKGSKAEVIESTLYRLLGRLGGLFRAAVDRGELRKDINIENAALAFWSFYLQALFLGLRADDFNLDSMLLMVEDMIDMLFHGLKPE